MRLYKSHKVVAAAAIVSVIADEEGKKLPQYVLDDGDTVEHPQGTNYLPKVGDYYVTYDGGYSSLSPKAAFDDGYSPYSDAQAAVDGRVAYGAGAKFDFAHAVRLLKVGKRVAREGWNGKGMFLFLVPGSEFKVNRPPLLGIYAEGTPIKYHAHVDMKTATGDIVPWLCSQTDMLAEDWCVLEDEPELPLYEKDRECQGKCGECDCAAESLRP